MSKVRSGTRQTSARQLSLLHAPMASTSAGQSCWCFCCPTYACHPTTARLLLHHPSRRATLPCVRAGLSWRRTALPAAFEGRSWRPQRSTWNSCRSRTGSSQRWHSWRRRGRSRPWAALCASAGGCAAPCGASAPGSCPHGGGQAAAAAAAEPAAAAQGAASQAAPCGGSGASTGLSSTGGSGCTAAWHAAAVTPQAREPAKASVSAQRGGAGVQPMAGCACRYAAVLAQHVTQCVAIGIWP